MCFIPKLEFYSFCKISDKTINSIFLFIYWNVLGVLLNFYSYLINFITRKTKVHFSVIYHFIIISSLHHFYWPTLELNINNLSIFLWFCQNDHVLRFGEIKSYRCETFVDSNSNMCNRIWIYPDSIQPHIKDQGILYILDVFILL